MLHFRVPVLFTFYIEDRAIKALYDESSSKIKTGNLITKGFKVIKD
jgi:hypothetical protein